MRRSDGPYPFLPKDPRAECYFRSLSGELQGRIRALDRYPSTYQELLDAVDRARNTMT